MRTELKRIHKTIAYTIIYVTHDQIEAMTLSDRVAIMNEGELMQIGTPLEVYEQPHNMFVAGFIGSPPINFINAELKEQAGKLVVATPDFSLSLPKDKLDLVRERRAPPVVTLGIRPQNIYEKGRSPQMLWSGNEITATVDVTEPLGDAVVATVIAGKQIFQATLPPDTKAKPDQPIELVVDLGKLHLFDPETKEAIF